MDDAHRPDHRRPLRRGRGRRAVALLLCLTAAGTLSACGGEVAESLEGVQDAQERVDEVQRDVDRVTDAIRDPAGAIDREVDRATEDLERRVDEVTGVVTDPAGALRDRADEALEDVISPEDQP